MKHSMQKENDLITTANHLDEDNTNTQAGGLPVRTDLRAGLAWDDLDDQAKGLWDSLTNAINGSTGETQASS